MTTNSLASTLTTFAGGNMNKEVIQGKWTEIKGEIQKAWGSLTSDEIEKTKGDMKAIAGLLQQKYGFAKDEADSKLNSLYARFTGHKEGAKQKASEAVSNKVEDIKKSLRN